MTASYSCVSQSAKIALDPGPAIGHQNLTGVGSHTHSFDAFEHDPRLRQPAVSEKRRSLVVLPLRDTAQA